MLGVDARLANGRAMPARYCFGVCMNCVASGAPMITVGLTVMRRRALKAWFLMTLARVRPAR